MYGVTCIICIKQGYEKPDNVVGGWRQLLGCCMNLLLPHKFRNRIDPGPGKGVFRSAQVCLEQCFQIRWIGSMDKSGTQNCISSSKTTNNTNIVLKHTSQCLKQLIIRVIIYILNIVAHWFSAIKFLLCVIWLRELRCIVNRDDLNIYEIHEKTAYKFEVVTW